MDNSEKKVLVVDDSSDVLELLKELLTEKGYDVIIANNGLEGIERVKKDSPDLAIVDIMMPYMDGYHMIYNLINHEHIDKLPYFIILSVRSKTIDNGVGEKIGACAYLEKPFKNDDIIQLIESAFNN